MSTHLTRKIAGVPVAADIYPQHFAVEFDYPVCFTRGVFSSGNDVLERVLRRHDEARTHRVKVFLDAGLVQAAAHLPDLIKEYFHARSMHLELAGGPEVLPGGEAAKNGWKTVSDVLWTLGNLHLDRQSYVIGVGGGAFLDMLGLATSLVHRGLRFVRVPTTVLGQCDAGIGVKNGMDEHGMKNFVGTFCPPSAVLNDLDLLRTLSLYHWVGGVAEAFKVAIIKDAGFFDFLCCNAHAIRSRDEAVMEEVIRRCAILHLDHIRTGGDPFEFGSARPLDFGHWSTHRIECMSHFRISHGQGVAIGIAIDSQGSHGTDFGQVPCPARRLLARRSGLLPLSQPLRAPGWLRGQLLRVPCLRRREIALGALLSGPLPLLSGHAPT